MTEKALFEFVGRVRRQALSPATLSAALATGEAKAREKVGRAKKPLSPEDAKRKALLDGI